MSSNFIFLLHFHQPHGQLRYVNERIYENSYKLLLDIFREYSDLKFTVHVSGPLLLYLKETHPDYLEELFKLGDIGSIEFIGGTISEAILPLVPSSERVDHIVKYLDLFEKLSGIRPRGFWLPERVWEPWLPEVLAKANIEYVVVDDAVLRKTGHSTEKTRYAWITEESGYMVKVLFIDEKLRYILPWEHPDRVIEYMKTQSQNTPILLLWGSDAEKFGEWMDRDRSRYWLREFLNRLRYERGVTTTHPLEYLREHGVRGYIYLDTGSYDKMLEWSGGFFRNFLVKYSESNNMHKKALWVKRKLEKARGSVDEKTYIDYYLAYCNDAYWHGLFGGLYLAHLRQAIYENLIKAEREAENALSYYNTNSTKRILVDFDYDGRLELLIESKKLNLYIKPSDGGTVFEIDIKEKGFEHNIQDTMTRYPEPYLESTGFNPDWYRRVSWRIHIWSPDTSIGDWIYNTPFKDTSDLALINYNLALSEDPREVYLRTIGNVYSYGSRTASLFVEKKITIGEYGYSVTYRLKNLGENTVRGKLGLEYHLAWKIDRSMEREQWYSIDGKSMKIEYSYSGKGRSIRLQSGIYPDIFLKTNRDIDIWVTKLSSYARTEKGLKEIPQGLAVMFIEDIDMAKGTELELRVDHGIELP